MMACNRPEGIPRAILSLLAAGGRRSSPRNSRLMISPLRWVLLILCFGLCFGLAVVAPLRAQLSSSSWSSIGGAVVPSRVTAIDADPRSGNTVVIATPAGGIWKSEDEGINWTPLTETTATLQFCSLARDPSQPDFLYAGTGDDLEPHPGQGVMRSSNGGFTWTRSLPFSNRPVCALAVDPTDGRRIAAGSEDGLYISVDSGTNWKRVRSTATTAVAFDAQGRIFTGLPVATSRTGILAVSTNGGDTFTDIALPTVAGETTSRTTFVSVLVHGSAVYLAVAYVPSDGSGPTIDVYRSADGGTTWNVTVGIAAASPPMRLLSDAAGARLYLTGSTRLMVSANRGETWSTISSIKQRIHAATFAANTLWLAGDLGLERFTAQPGGPSLANLSPPIAQFVDLTATSINDVFAASPTGLFAYNGTNSLWSTLSSTDVFSGVAAGNVSASGQRTILANGLSAFHRSTDGGAVFSSTTAIPAAESRAPNPPLLADPGSLANVYVAGQLLYRSTDQGTTFSAFGTIDPDRTRVVTALAAAPLARRFMYAATACIPPLAGAAGCPTISYIWRSTNSGQTWTQGAPVTGWVHQLAVDPRQTATVYATIGDPPFSAAGSRGEAGDVLRSTDNALSWLSLRSNLPRGTLRSIAIDALSLPAGNLPAQTIYVGGDNGGYATYNGGTQWIAINTGLPRSPVTILRQAGADAIIAGTKGRGAFQTRVLGVTASVIITPLELSASITPGDSATLSLTLTNVLATRANWSLAVSIPSGESWLSVSESGGTLDPRASAQVTVRVNSTNLAPGSYFGRLVLTSGSLGGATTSQSIPLDIRIEATLLRLSAVTGNSASGGVNTSVPPFVVSLLNEDGIPASGESISFAITSGGGLLNRRTSITDAEGMASTVLTLPATAGITQVTATYRDQSVVFTAQAVQIIRPALQAGAAVNAATYASNASLASGGIISIFGLNLADDEARAAVLPLPVTLRATRALLISSASVVALPLFYVSPVQVNAVLPFNLTPGAYGLTIENAGVRGNEIQVIVSVAAPGIFTVDSSGRGTGIFLKADGSLVSTANAAVRGSVVSMYAVGLGPVNPALPAGEPGRTSEPLNRTTLAPRVFFDNLEAEITFSGIAPGFAGLYQVNARVPAGLSPASNIPVSLIIGGVASNRVTVPVQ
ncbi:MAG: hypothetical protein EXQ56_03255 [Acidobacteria bacterium]|nr:hypothetical protein [Acidobacteriota bacterium]